MAEVLPSALGALGVEGWDDLLGLGPCRAVVLLVVDGLGWRQLRAAEDDAPFLASAPGRTIDAVAPTTTVSGLASIGTGRPPGRHQLLGYTMAHPDHDQPFNPLTWRVGMRGGGADVRGEIVPEALQPEPTVLEQAQAAGVATTVLLHPTLLDTGLTRAALRGGQRVGVSGLAATLVAAAHHTTGPGPSLVYAHHGDVDQAGHVHGPFSDPWRQALRDVDAALASTVSRLPSDVVVLVTADHGMVEVPDGEVVEAAEHDVLLEGVRVFAGEPRLRQLACLPGASGDVAARWHGIVGDRADIVSCDQAIEAGWFGPGVSARARELLGDVLVAMRRGTVVHGRVDPHGGRHRGQHGSLTDDEIEVPLLLLRGGAGWTT